MECFIIKEGIEQKAELEDILPLISDKGIQNIFRDAKKSYINLQLALAHMATNLIRTIEKACDSGQLKISIYDTDHMTEEDIQKAFEAFQYRGNELQRIRSLEISANDLPYTALLFETGALEELKIDCGYIASWPSFLEKCQSLKSIELRLWNGLVEFPSWTNNVRVVLEILLAYFDNEFKEACLFEFS